MIGTCKVPWAVIWHKIKQITLTRFVQIYICTTQMHVMYWATFINKHFNKDIFNHLMYKIILLQSKFLNYKGNHHPISYNVNVKKWSRLWFSRSNSIKSPTNRAKHWLLFDNIAYLSVRNYFLNTMTSFSFTLYYFIYFTFSSQTTDINH